MVFRTRAQSTIIGMALLVIAMVFAGAVFLSLVAKTARLLDAGRREIEFLTEKAKKDLGGFVEVGACGRESRLSDTDH